MSTRKADGGTEVDGNHGDEVSSLVAAAEDILRAIESKDANHLAQAIRSAIEIVDSESDSATSTDGTDLT